MNIQEGQNASGSGSGGCKGTTFPCIVSDLHADQRSQSEVTTTPYHIRSDFRLKRRSHHNGFVVVFLRSSSRKHKTYRYSLQLGTLGVDRTIFRITLSACTSVRLSICQSVILSMCPILSEQYLLNRSTILNQTWYCGVLSGVKLSVRKKTGSLSSMSRSQ